VSSSTPMSNISTTTSLMKSPALITGFENLPRGNFAVFSVIEDSYQTLFSSNSTLPQRNSAIVYINDSIAQLCADAHLRPARR
jgi:hypothetical protein